jgi:formylmethanofuran dehydrogenase subunit E
MTDRFEIFRADNVMVAVMYEQDGGVEREIDRFHGHIIHEGAIGVAQAASYAMKKLYTNMNGGSMLVYGGEEDV